MVSGQFEVFSVLRIVCHSTRSFFDLVGLNKKTYKFFNIAGCLLYLIYYKKAIISPLTASLTQFVLLTLVLFVHIVELICLES